MKKFISKILPACVIVIVILLIWLGLRLINGDGTLPSYRFLGGRNPVACRDVKGINKVKRVKRINEKIVFILCIVLH